MIVECSNLHFLGFCVCVCESLYCVKLCVCVCVVCVCCVCVVCVCVSKGVLEIGAFFPARTVVVSSLAPPLSLVYVGDTWTLVYVGICELCDVDVDVVMVMWMWLICYALLYICLSCD